MYTVGAVADLIGKKGSTSPSPTKKAAKAKELPQPVGPALRYTEVKSQTASPQKGTAKRKHGRAGKRLSAEGLPPQRGKKGKQLGLDDSPELNDASFDGSESGSDDGPHASTKFVKGTARNAASPASSPVSKSLKKEKKKRKFANDCDGGETNDNSEVAPPAKRRKSTHSDADTQQRRPRKSGQSEDPHDPEKSDRTIFVGNLPGKATAKDLQHMFKKYGPIESIRFRSIVPAKESLSKKVAFINKALHASKQNVNAYVVFKQKEAVKEALTLNGSVALGNHIRVDVVSSSKPQGSEKKTVFVGNLPHEIQDEELWKFFSECGEVEAVRLIRDRASGMGKGFGFVTFKKLDGAALAMEMTGRELSGRPLRVTAYSKQATPKRSFQPGHAVQKKGKSSKHDPSLEATDFKGSKAERFMKKKKLKKQIRAKKQQKLQKKIFHLGGAPPKKEKNKNEAKQSE
ncbi:uncharacterized protein LOC144169898 [Haemaphysalis longicornis]